ncbi:NADH-quinone oxidoreductase subunit NuoH [Eoetvoesiella caeni]|uniref:NADH-quinone oxidoreductase subunit H n=1 Tax=Eoetvoesiella caeni TaxID=645616 RepID=A0A366HKQ2_9BURK|nr:NADH-quinone oxidoreductase subunit NuoH [Eoetvoesiella caeni]MCI2807070.1 NADH-quinone oxidoreductase subunit NuoH [Eoetvoesiella caeni]NYT53533.1 NADH-quinone oxidoreductase subunit NuoH [Eoetvoesiella caeni]RBP43519.1 NADH dehydrogenase subunit H [Eoetvoesiella caeni]
MEWVNTLDAFGTGLIGATPWYVVWTIVKILLIAVPIILCVAYLTYWERKLIGAMHVRLGPTRVGYRGLLQPFADVFKLLSKELILPAKSNKVLFLIAPVVTLMPSLAAWAVIPFSPELVLSNINAGLLYIIAVTSLGVYGVIVAGWASNSKYALLGAMRAAAQMVSYELAIGFVMITVLLVSGSLNMSEIVLGQDKGWFAQHGVNFMSWNWLPLLPLFIIYVISCVAETNRHPFDVVEGESEIVAGPMVEYSGTGFALFFLGEYANMILLSAVASIMFLGGWLPIIDVAPFTWVPGWIWLGIKTFCVVSMFIWFRATFPRYRYDQIMRLGWKVFIPFTGVWLVLVAIWMQTPWNIWH